VPTGSVIAITRE